MKSHTHKYPGFTENQEYTSICMELALWYLAARQPHFIEVVTKRLVLARINLLTTNWYGQECPTSMKWHALSILHNNCGQKVQILSTSLKFFEIPQSTVLFMLEQNQNSQLRSTFPRKSQSSSFVPSIFMKNKTTRNVCATAYLYYTSCYWISAYQKNISNY